MGFIAEVGRYWRYWEWCPEICKRGWEVMEGWNRASQGWEYGWLEWSRGEEASSKADGNAVIQGHRKNLSVSIQKQRNNNFSRKSLVSGPRRWVYNSNWNNDLVKNTAGWWAGRRRVIREPGAGRVSRIKPYPRQHTDRERQTESWKHWRICWGMATAVTTSITWIQYIPFFRSVTYWNHKIIST